MQWHSSKWAGEEAFLLKYSIYNTNGVNMTNKMHIMDVSVRIPEKKCHIYEIPRTHGGVDDGMHVAVDADISMKKSKLP